MTAAPLSVVIAAHNAAGTIDRQLESLTTQLWPAGGEIIVADNGSTDETADIVRARSGASDHVTIDVVDASQHRGAGHARNIGVAHAHHGSIAFCDADDVVGDQWVAEMARALQESPAVGGRLDFDALNPSWVVGSRGRLVASEELPMFEGTFPVLSSCNLGIDRALFDDLGGFDTDYVRGQDAELSWRLHKAGIRAAFVPTAVIHYRMRGSVREIFDQARGWGEAQVAIRSAMSTSAPAIPRRRTARSWLWLASRIPTLTTRTGRARWAHVAGTRVGTAAARRGRTRSTPGVAAP